MLRGGRDLRLDDAKLVEAAIAGERAARGELARRHWDELFNVAYLVLRDVHAAEDVTQEALMAALDSLERFDRTRPLRPWLMKILTNRALDHGRAIQRRGQLHDRLASGQVAGPTSADPGNAALRGALEDLTPEDRALLVLRYVLEYRSGEIAETLELSPGTVRSRLKRALDQMRTTMNVEVT